MSSKRHGMHRAESTGRRISVLAAGVAVALSGCVASDLQRSAEGPESRVTAAYFREDPALLLKAAKDACRNPGEEFVQPRRGVAQCRLLMDPQTTAAVILQFDGAIDPLPQLVVSLASTRVGGKTGGGHVVAGCAFLKVPRNDGRIGRIVPKDPAVDAKLREMLRAVGGEPLQTVPPDAVQRCFAL